SPLPICLPIDTCMKLREAHQLPEKQSCFYRDRTTVKTGVIPDVDDCAALDEGLCATNCPCEAFGATCEFLSETDPIGVCATTTCRDFGSPTIPCEDHEVCAYFGPYDDFEMDVWFDLQASI